MVLKLKNNPPWFWKVRKNKAAAGRKEVRAGPRIMSRKDEEEFMKTQRVIIQERCVTTPTHTTPEISVPFHPNSPASSNDSKKSWADIMDEEDDEWVNH